LRAVHFHPHGVPLLLSAEVNDVNPARSGQSATNEHEVPPLRAVTAPPAAGEWETAYAAASAAAAAAMGGGAANGSGIGLSDRSARGAQGIGTGRERSRTTYIAARSAPSSNPGSPVLSSQPSADADDLEEIARLRVRSPMEIDGAGGSTGVSRGNDSSTTRQQLFRAPGGDASASTAADQIQRDQPCTVKLKLWRYDRRNPLAPLSDARLVIPHAVLCSEMGAHFSPCGRLLAACVACLPKDAPEPVAGEPIPRLVYELRVYSLEEKNFGEVLAARSVRAAHCLTSIQFSPTSEHVLLAYGRRHSSLLLLIADGGSCITVHTILEVYRISDMSLVRVLPSAEDEVNVACFHPAAGGGLAYGTKEGRLRILRHDKPPPRNASKRPMAIGRCLEDELLEVLDWSGLDADADGLPVENSGSDTD
jgi:activator-of-BECN1-regulated-autophagy protein 1